MIIDATRIFILTFLFAWTFICTSDQVSLNIYKCHDPSSFNEDHNLQPPSKRLLALKEVLAGVSTVVVGGITSNVLIVQRAVSAMRLAVLVQVVCIVHLRHLQRLLGDVNRLLLKSVLAADQVVEWAGEELGSEPVLGGVDGFAVAVVVLWWDGALWWGHRDGDVGLVVSVGCGDDDLELLLGVAGVGGRGLVDAASPERALEAGLRWGVGAALSPDGWVAGVVVGVVVGWVEGWVTLGVDVKGGAQLGAVAVSSALVDVVGLQGVETEVRLGSGGAVQVLEDLCVLLVVGGWNDGGCGLSGRVELAVGLVRNERSAMFEEAFQRIELTKKAEAVSGLGTGPYPSG